MSPQFVDFDADGKLDIVAGTFDGSPHLARGDGSGWNQPEQILDATGKRIVLNEFWNFDTKKWDKGGETGEEGHCTSAVAFDWDGDGDLDLLLGDHRSGRIYRRINEGTASKPAFGGKNLLLHADGKPIDVRGTVATMRLFDWNRDGLADLLTSGMGDAYENEEGGGVWLFVNSGTKTDTRFAAPIEFVAPSKKGALGEPKRPDSGLYADAGDIDGDGDFDLIVGGYSHWTPTPPKLTDEQKVRVAELTKIIDEADKKLDALNEEMSKLVNAVPAAEREKKFPEIYASKKDVRAAIMKERTPALEEREQIAPGPKRISYVWLYENKSGAAKSN
ncbi:MAG TPA: FG-GAP-like repeat-containing protein [Planctomycetota bacterium]|nr:FG-GAP-like repeat-containing protein [Planctomycetota bacterium]